MIIKQIYGLTVTGYRYPHAARPFADYYSIDGLKVENFQLTASDYDVGDDQIVCPCGEELYRQTDEQDDSMGDLGWAIRVAEQHLTEAHGRAAVKAAESEEAA